MNSTDSFYSGQWYKIERSEGTSDIHLMRKKKNLCQLQRKCLTQIASSSSRVPPWSPSTAKSLHKWGSGLQSKKGVNLQRNRGGEDLNLPRSAYTLTLWVMGKFTTPTPPISTASFIKAAINCEPACLAVFAPIVFSMRLLIKSGSTITTSILDVEARTRSLEANVIMNDLVDAWETMLYGLFLSEIEPTIHYT